jgi:ribosomal protein S18 acetylase RimI-like enzyme
MKGENMKDIIIRKANGPDLPIIFELMKELMEAMNDVEGYDVDTVFENCRFLLNDVNSNIMVAEIDGQVVGVIKFTTRKTFLHSGLSGLIDEFVVAKSYRGKGIGSQLINAVIEKCRLLGCCEIEMTTEYENTRAIEFYKKFGFEERGPLFEKELCEE